MESRINTKFIKRSKEIKYTKKVKWNLKRNWILYLMVFPAIVFVIIFNYLPMGGIIIAFQDYQPIQGFTGSPFVGLYWFKTLLNVPDIKQVVFNTLYISILKIIFGQLASIIFALLLNEVGNSIFKRSIQTLVYLPYFLSWVIVGGIFIDILSTDGIVNKLLKLFGLKSIFFLGSNDWFRFTLVTTDIWKGFGWGAILYLAAITLVNPELYEAAVIDGANKLKQTIHVTIPAMVPTIVLLATLSLGDTLNAGFEQILMLYNPAVYRTGDVIDTFVYRQGLIQLQYSLSTAVDIFKSVVSLILIFISYKLADKYANYRIF